MDDKEKLILIAQVFGQLNGKFTAQMIYDFIFTNKHKFRKAMTSKRIGVLLSRSNKFERIESKSHSVYYKVV